MPREKRKPGGQPKNSNARKHGFYSAGVSGAMRRALRRAATLDDAGLFEEIRLARAYISETLNITPENGDVLQRFLSMLTRMVAVDHMLDRHEEDAIGLALQELVAELLPWKDPEP